MAVLEARANVARANATRSGYYTPYCRVTIAGVDRSKNVLKKTFVLTQELDHQPDVLRLQLRGGTRPQPGQSVIVGVGAIDNRIFKGTILQVRQIQRKRQSTPRWEISATDSWLFNRRVVLAEYTGDAADIIRSIVSTYTSGFTTVHVPASLGTVTNGITYTNVSPAVAITRVCQRVGARWYVDPNDDVHAFAPPESGVADPPNLTDDQTHFWGLEWEDDITQLRNRVYAEGVRVSTLLQPTEATAVVLLNRWLAVDNVDLLPSYGATVRVGRFGRFSFIAKWPGGEGSIVSSPVAPGANTIAVNSASPWYSQLRQHALVGGQVVAFSGVGISGGLGWLYNLPSSGTGSVQAPISDGESIVTVPELRMSFNIGTANDLLLQDAPAGTPVVLYAQDDDTTAQSDLAAIEGGDGIHEYVMQDGRWVNVGAVAQAELDLYADGEDRGQYLTRHGSARVGRQVVINLGSSGNISSLTVTHQRVTLSNWIEKLKRGPLRTVEFSTQHRDLYEILRGVEAPPDVGD